MDTGCPQPAFPSLRPADTAIFEGDRVLSCQSFFSAISKAHIHHCSSGQDQAATNTALSLCISPKVSNRKFKTVAVWLLALGLSGCSDQRFDAERLKQQMPTYISYAAEGELYVNYLARGESTRAFRAQHAEYLRKNVL